MKRAASSDLEGFILTAVLILGDGAYEMRVFSKACELAKRQLNRASIFRTLRRLEQKGSIGVRIVAAGGTHPKSPLRFYHLLPRGGQAFVRSLQTQTAIANAFWGIDEEERMAS